MTETRGAASRDPLRVDPFDADEERIIGALLMGHEQGYDDVICEIVRALTPAHFQVPRFRSLFRRFKAGERVMDPAFQDEIGRAGGVERLMGRIACADFFVAPLARLQRRARHEEIRAYARWLLRDPDQLETVLAALSRLRPAPEEMAA